VTATTGFGDRVCDTLGRFGPLCVGIDPHPHLLADWGVEATSVGAREFGLRVVDAAAGRVGIVKPQVSFFERFGPAGFIALEQVMAAARAADLIVIADAKRGDIGTTMAAYAAAWAADGPLCCDAVTASPYLGFGSLQPLLDTAAAHGRGVFVLAATSNPEGASVQQATGADGRTVAQAIVDAAAAVNTGNEPGSVGVVVGATLTAVPDVSALGGPVLVPGVGAQGGRPAALAGLGGALPGQLLPAVSREVLRAGPDVTAVRDAAERMRDAVAHLA